MTRRILHVISSLDLRTGGPAVALRGLASGQRRAGMDVRVIATHQADESMDVADRLEAEGVSVTRVGPCWGRLVRHPDLAAVMAECVAGADIVHIHALYADVQYLAAREATRRGKPYIIRPCGMLDAWSLRRSRLVKRVYMAWRLSRMLREAAALHYTSDLERLDAAHLSLRPRTIVEPHGVNLAEYETLPEPGGFRNKFEISARAPLIVFLGRVHPGKGVERLIPALAACTTFDARLAIVGPDSGGYMAAMRSLAEQCGVADRVVFTGLLSGSDRVAALAAATVFALPSEHENFAIAAAEAMAAGKPVIISPHTGIADDVVAANAGSVVPLEPVSLAAEIDRWLSDPARCAEAGARARAYALARYDWLEIGRRWGGHYTSLLGQTVAA